MHLGIYLSGLSNQRYTEHTKFQLKNTEKLRSAKAQNVRNKTLTLILNKDCRIRKKQIYREVYKPSNTNKKNDDSR